MDHPKMQLPTEGLHFLCSGSVREAGIGRQGDIIILYHIKA